MGTIYRNGQYYGGSPNGGAKANLERREIGYGDNENNIVGSGLYTKNSLNIVEELCEEQSNALEFIIDQKQDGDMPAGAIIVSNGTLETEYNYSEYVKDYEGHSYIGPILHSINSGENYIIKFNFETFNQALAEKDYFISFIGYEEFANIKMEKDIEIAEEAGVTVYTVSCIANTEDVFKGQILFPLSTGNDLAIYNGNADQDGGKIFLKDKGLLTIQNNGELFIGGNNLTTLDGDTAFTMHDSSIIDMSDEAKFCMNDEKVVFSNTTGEAELTIEELNNLRNGLYEEVVPYELPVATEDTLGGIKIGQGIDINDGVISVTMPEPPVPYELPIATENTLGGIKIGEGLNITEDGTVSVINNGQYVNYSEGDAISFGNQDSNIILPLEYKRVQFIGTDGYQYIPTDYTPLKNDVFEFDGIVSSGANDYIGFLFGSRNKLSGCTNCYYLLINLNGKTSLYYNRVDGSSQYFEKPIGDMIFDERILIRTEKDQIKISTKDTSNNYSITPAQTDCVAPLYLFYCNFNENYIPTSAIRGLPAMLYDFKVYRNNVIIHHYIPSVREADNIPGVYDICNDTFYPQSNKVNTKLIIGPEYNYSENKINVKYDRNTLTINENNELTVINNNDETTNENKKYYPGNGIVFESSPYVIPSEYQEIEYIETTQSMVFNTEYINTKNTRILADMMVYESDSSYNWASLFGARSGYGAGNFFLFSKSGTNSQYGIGTIENTFTAIVQNKRLLIDFSRQSLKIHNIVDNFDYNTVNINLSGIDGVCPIYIFGLNTNNNSTLNRAPSRGRLYSFKIYEEQELKKYFIPVYRKADNVYGLYDLIENVFIVPIMGNKTGSGDEIDIHSKNRESISVNISNNLDINENGELDLKIKIISCTQEQYDALEIKDPNTLYLIGD